MDVPTDLAHYMSTITELFDKIDQPELPNNQDLENFDTTTTETVADMPAFFQNFVKLLQDCTIVSPKYNSKPQTNL